MTVSMKSRMQDLRSKTDAELTLLVQESRETIRAERFKDAFTRKASVIATAKRTVAQALTELTTRRRNPKQS
jgi:ribosomal protein L29